MLLLRGGDFEAAEAHFRAAIKRATWKKRAAPMTASRITIWGLRSITKNAVGKRSTPFLKAAWTSAQQEMAFYYAAVIAAGRKEYAPALEHIERALVKNSHSLKALGVKAFLLREAGAHGRGEGALRRSARAGSVCVLPRGGRGALPRGAAGAAAEKKCGIALRFYRNGGGLRGGGRLRRGPYGSGLVQCGCADAEIL